MSSVTQKCRLGGEREGKDFVFPSVYSCRTVTSVDESNRRCQGRSGRQTLPRLAVEKCFA